MKYIGGTIKTEALHLLALETLTDIERHRVNVLTANQQGFDIYDDLVENGLRDYVNSIDACMALFPTEQYIVLTKRNPDLGICWIYPVANPHICMEYVDARTVARAILKAWWSIQPD